VEWYVTLDSGTSARLRATSARLWATVCDRREAVTAAIGMGLTYDDDTRRAAGTRRGNCDVSG
jgi:hypothetical protein